MLCKDLQSRKKSSFNSANHEKKSMSIFSSSATHTYSSNFNYSVERMNQSRTKQNNDILKNNNHQNSVNQKSIDLTSGEMPSWVPEFTAISSTTNTDKAQPNAAKADKTQLDAPDTGEQPLLRKDELVRQNFAEHFKENGNILEAVRYAKSETFKTLFAEKLAQNGGNVDEALSYGRAQFRGEITDDELIEIVTEILEEGKGKSFDGKVEKALENELERIKDETRGEEKILEADEPFSKILTKNNPPISENDSHIAEAFAYTKTQFKDGAKLENNKEAKEIFEQRLADNKSGKNKNDRSVNLLHVVA